MHNRPKYLVYNNDYGYSLKYPREWVISSSSENGDGVIFDIDEKDIDVRVFRSLNNPDIPDDDYKYSKQDFLLSNGNKAYLIEYFNGPESFLKIVLNKDKDGIKYTFMASGPEKYIKNNKDLFLQTGYELNVKRNLGSTFSFADRVITLYFKDEPKDFLVDKDGSCVKPFICGKYVRFDNTYKLFSSSSENNINIVDQKYLDSEFKDRKYSEDMEGGLGKTYFENTFLISQIKLNHSDKGLILIKENRKILAKFNDNTESFTEKTFSQCAIKLRYGKYFLVSTVFSGIDQDVNNCEYLIANLKSVLEISGN